MSIISSQPPAVPVPADTAGREPARDTDALASLFRAAGALFQRAFNVLYPTGLMQGER